MGELDGLRNFVAAGPGHVDHCPTSTYTDRLNHRRAARALDSDTEFRDEATSLSRLYGSRQRLASVHEELHPLPRLEVRTSHRERREVGDSERRALRVGTAERCSRGRKSQRRDCDQKRVHYRIISEQSEGPAGAEPSIHDPSRS